MSRKLYDIMVQELIVNKSFTHEELVQLGAIIEQEIKIVSPIKLLPQVSEIFLFNNGMKLEAIKSLWRRTGCSLREAKAEIDKLENKERQYSL